jgi:hypothetical protein
MAFEQYDKLGHPGKFAEVVIVTSGDLILTGSNYGVSAIIRGVGVSGSINLSNGGSVALSDLDAGVIHELSPQSVTNIGGGNLYLLKRA